MSQQPTKCKFFFYRKLNTGALEQITDGNGDNDWEFVSLTKNVLPIDRDYIGHEQTYVVKASYSKDGAPSSKPDSDIDYVSTTIRRRIPSIEIDWEGFPQQVADGTKMIYRNRSSVIRQGLSPIPRPSLSANGTRRRPAPPHTCWPLPGTRPPSHAPTA